MSDCLWQDGQTVVMIGDSITDCGRRAERAPFGAGYVRQTIDLMTARYPERRIIYFNEGIGGNTVEDLRGRWHDDVLVHQPDWVTVLVGINDLHRTLAAAPTSVPADKFEHLYREALQLTRERTNARIVLLDPFYISTDTDSQSHRSRVLGMLGDYIAVVHRLVGEFETLHVRTHDEFQEQLSRRSADDFCPEPVHPNEHGHLVITNALLEQLGW